MFTMINGQRFGLGFIRKQDRTPAQHAAALLAESTMAAINAADLLKHVPTTGVCLRLSDAWSDPLVVADIGLAFPRYRQLTGSCVGAGGGNALMTLIGVQRKLAANPTVAFLPFWPFDYGKCRQEEGDRGQGEGAMGSSFAASVVNDGVLAATQPGLPPFANNDGLILTSALEMQSSAGATIPAVYTVAAKQFPMGSTAPLKNVQDIKAAILNGYPGSFACDNYIGSANIQGSGANARTVGFWNGRGGHQQYFIAYEDNPELGPLYGIGNNWAGDTYPADPGGLPICCCWVKEVDVTRAFGYDSEVYAFSHLKYLPAQPAVLNWVM